jgi:hypothetical protein
MPGSLASADGSAGVELVEVTELTKVVLEGANTTLGSTANTLNSNKTAAGTPNSHVMSKRMLHFSVVFQLLIHPHVPCQAIPRREYRGNAKVERKKLHPNCQNCRLARPSPAAHEYSHSGELVRTRTTKVQDDAASACAVWHG